MGNNHIGRLSARLAQLVMLCTALCVILAIGCNARPSSSKAPTSVTFPPPDRNPDWAVRFRADTSFEELDAFTRMVTLQAGSLTEATRIDAESHTVYIYLRQGTSKDDAAQLRKAFMNSPIVLSVDDV